MSEVNTQPEVTEVDMGEVGVVADAPPETMVKQDIGQFIDSIYNTDFTNAEKQFNDLVSDRLQAQLDQAKVAMAGQMFNNDAPEEVEPEPENDELDDYEDQLIADEEEDTAEMEGKEIFSGSYLEN